MCGRYAFAGSDRKKIGKRFGLRKMPEAVRGGENIAPFSEIPVILNSAPGELTTARWGLVPHWAKDEKTGYEMFNARADTIAEKPAFKGPIRHRRCLIPADAFYEWQGEKGRKKAFRISMKDDALFAFAGIWDTWDMGNRRLRTCSIITTEANDLVREIHGRMPVILPEEDERAWLEDRPLRLILDMLRPYDPASMKAEEVALRAPRAEGGADAVAS